MMYSFFREIVLNHSKSTKKNKELFSLIVHLVCLFFLLQQICHCIIDIDYMLVNSLLLLIQDFFLNKHQELLVRYHNNQVYNNKVRHKHSMRNNFFENKRTIFVREKENI